MTGDTRAIVHALCLIAAAIRAGSRDENEPNLAWADAQAANILRSFDKADLTEPYPS